MSDVGDIKAATASMVVAINGKDAAGSAAHYSDDGIVLPPGAPQMAGREAVQGYWQALADMNLHNVAITPDEIEVLGDHAIDRGTLSGKLGDQDVAGKYVVWWKRTGDGWKIYNDIFNFDA